MDNKLYRVATFVNWPVESGVHPLELAENGFFYTKKRDEVECFSCRVTLDCWRAGMSLLQRHLQYSPDCTFINSKVTTLPNNRQRPPSGQHYQSAEEPSQQQAENSIQGQINSTYQRHSILTSQLSTVEPMERNTMKSNDDVLREIRQNNSGCNWYKPRSVSESTPGSCVDYTVESNRHVSFRNRWDISNPMNPVELASAGLYYTGPGDRVQCAFCGGGLYNWADGDTAFGEHINHFPLCSFVQDNQSRFLARQPIQEEEQEICQPNHIENKPEEPLNSGGSNDWKSSDAVKIAKDMGYQSDVIKQAVEKVFSVSCGKLSSERLMDAIFEIEILNSSVTEGPTSPRNGATNNNSLQGAVGGSDIKRRPKEIVTNQTIPTTTKDDETSVNYKESTDEELKRLTEENLRLKGNTQCKICLENEVDVLFLPCRHLVCCEECSNAVQSCPCCRAQIVGTVKTYLA